MHLKRTLTQTFPLLALFLFTLPSSAQPVIKAASGFDHSLFLKGDGSLWAMGYNIEGQLGDGTFGYDVQTNLPELIVASDVTAIAAGGSHSLFIKIDGSLWGMGASSSGQLGNGSYFRAKLPVQIVASDVTAIVAGAAYSLILYDDGSLWAAGDNAGNPVYGFETRNGDGDVVIKDGLVEVAG